MKDKIKVWSSSEGLIAELPSGEAFLLTESKQNGGLHITSVNPHGIRWYHHSSASTSRHPS